MTLRRKKIRGESSEEDLRDELARRAESLDRGEGLTTAALRRELERRRAEALAAAPKPRSRPARP